MVRPARLPFLPRSEIRRLCANTKTKISGGLRYLAKSAARLKTPTPKGKKVSGAAQAARRVRRPMDVQEFYQLLEDALLRKCFFFPFTFR